MTSNGIQPRQFWPFGGRRTFGDTCDEGAALACARFTKFPARIVRTRSMSFSGRHDAQALLKSVGGGS